MTCAAKPREYLGKKGKITSAAQAIGLKVVPGLGQQGDRFCSFESAEYPGEYLAYSGDREHKNLKFMKHPHNADFATFKVTKEEAGGYIRLESTHTETTYQLVLDGDFLVWTEPDKVSDIPMEHSQFKLVKTRQKYAVAKGKNGDGKDKGIFSGIFKKFGSALVDEETIPKPSPPLGKLAAEDNIRVRLPSIGVPLTRIQPKNETSKYWTETGIGQRIKSIGLRLQEPLFKPEVSRDEPMEMPAVPAIMNIKFFNSIGNATKPGSSFYFTKYTAGAICRFNLKGNIPKKNTVFRVLHNHFEKGYYAFEAVKITEDGLWDKSVKPLYVQMKDHQLILAPDDKSAKFRTSASFSVLSHRQSKVEFEMGENHLGISRALPLLPPTEP